VFRLKRFKKWLKAFSCIFGHSKYGLFLVLDIELTYQRIWFNGQRYEALPGVYCIICNECLDPEHKEPPEFNFKKSLKDGIESLRNAQAEVGARELTENV
jgi:hypothetical protein